MGIEAKRRRWELGEINVHVYKTMTSKGHRKIKSLVVDIFMPHELDSHRLKVLKNTSEDCPVKLNLDESIDIELNWHKEKV